MFTVICTASRKSWLFQPRFQAPLDILFVIWLFRPIFLSKCHDFYCQGQQPSNRCSLGENNYTNDHHLIITYKKHKVVYINTFATAYQRCCNFEVKRTHNWPRVNYDRGKYWNETLATANYCKIPRAKPLDYKIRDTENKIYELQCMLIEMVLFVEG